MCKTETHSPKKKEHDYRSIVRDVCMNGQRVTEGKGGEEAKHAHSTKRKAK
jgi:hypothetical protein